MHSVAAAEASYIAHSQQRSVGTSKVQQQQQQQ
jgi:hypothetical protein